MSRKQIVRTELRKAGGRRVASWDLTLAGGGSAVHSRVAELRNEGHHIVCERDGGRYFYRLECAPAREQREIEAKRMSEARQEELFGCAVGD